MVKQKKQQKKKVLNQQLRRYKSYRVKINAATELGLNISKEDKYTIPIFIPHRGCKNSCVFCNQRQISGEQREVTKIDVKKRIDDFLTYYKENNKKVEIAFFGGSFTGLDIEEQIGFLEIAKKYIDEGIVSSIKISTRPDYITAEILETLKKYGVKTVELGVQSMNDLVLTHSKRGHTALDVEIASKLIKESGLMLGHQLMIGLPESSAEREIESVKRCIELNPDVVRIYPVYVLKKSELYEMYLNKEYIPLELEESVKRVKAMYLECVKNNINVIRIGLQVTEEINSKNEEIVGPVCDNYKERVLSSIMLDKIVQKIDNKICSKCIFGRWKIDPLDNINIYVPRKQINYAIGNLKENTLKLESKYLANIYIKALNE